MSYRPYLKKDHPDLPDSYNISIKYIDGSKDDFEVASHNLNPNTGIMQIWTKEDICVWVVTSNIKVFEFDKRFSKIVALKEKINKKEDE